MKLKLNKTREEKDMLYEKFHKLIPTVISDLHCVCRTKEEYEDYYEIAQIGLAKAINDIEGDTEDITTSFFYTYIRNELLNYFRYKTMKKRDLDGTDMADIDDKLIDSGINIEKDYLIKESNEQLHNAINKLKPNYKDVILRRFGIDRERQTIVEVANDYGRTRQAVQQLEVRALNKLKKELLNE